MSTVSRKRLHRFLSVIVIIAHLVAYGPALHANPQGGVVAAGQATIQDSGAVTSITQGTDKAIINWQGFSNAAHETVRFSQPLPTSVTLNRVVGVDPSTIQGALQANGRIFLINPNGIVFGPNSRVDVGGLVASTLAISDQDFLRGNYTLAQTPGRSLASVINAGRITASPGGYVALVAPLVDNQGHIVAAAGRVVLAGTAQAVLNLDGAGLVSVQLPVAQARDVLLHGGTAADLAARAVNNGHIVEASAVRVQNGAVVLTGGEGVAVNQGVVSVSGTAGQPGGQVHIEGSRATVLAATSRIEAKGSGAAPGGTVEVSSKGRLALAGHVDTTSPSGRTGTLLIDPDEIIVSDGAGRPGTVSENFIESQNTHVSLLADKLITIEPLGELLLQPGVDFSMVSGGDILMQSFSDVIRTQAGGAITISAGTSGESSTMRLGVLESSGPLRLILGRQAGPGTDRLEVARATSDTGSVWIENAQGSVIAGRIDAADQVLVTTNWPFEGEGSITVGDVVARQGVILLQAYGSGDLRAGVLTSPVAVLASSFGGSLTVDRVAAPSALLSAAGDVTAETQVGLAAAYARDGSVKLVEQDGLVLDAYAHEDVSVRSLTGDIVVASLEAGDTAFLDAAGSIIMEPQPRAREMPGARIRAFHGDFHAGGSIALDTSVVRLDATAGTAADHSGDVVITNHGWLHLLGTITAGDDVRLDLQSDPGSDIAALVVVLGGPRGGIVSGRTVRIDVGSDGYYPWGEARGLRDLSALNALAEAGSHPLYEALTVLASSLPPLVAVLDGQILDNVLAGSPTTTNIAAQNKIDIRLHGPFFAPKIFGIPGLAPIEISTRSPEDVKLPFDPYLIGDVLFTDDVAIRTLTATGGTLSLYAPRGNVVDANGDAVNLDAGTVAVRAGGGIGTPGDPLETRIGNESLWALAAGGGLFLTEQDGLHLAFVRAAGDVNVRSLSGDILLGRIVSGGSIHLETTGSIFDNNGDEVNLIRHALAGGIGPLSLDPAYPSALSEVRLIAGGVIGTRADPIEVSIEDAALWTGARGRISCTSIALAGVVAPVNGLSLPWNPPGNVYWNGQMIFQGCRPLTPSGGEDTPGPTEPEVTPPLNPVVFVLPGAIDPSQVLKTVAGPTVNTSPTHPEPLVDTTMLP